MNYSKTLYRGRPLLNKAFELPATPPGLPSAMARSSSTAIQLDLVLHTAVDYVYGQGVGIGVVQRAEYATTGIIENHLIPEQERKYGITRENLVAENVKTAGRAQMLALVHALGLAYGTIKRGFSKAAQLQKVTIFSDSPKVVQTVNHHIKHSPDSLREVASTNDRSIINRVVTGARKLSHHGLEVSIAVSRSKDKAEEKARTMARQKGRKACRSRRRLRLIHGHVSVEEREEGVGNQDTFEETSELVIRRKESPDSMEHGESVICNE